MKRLFAILLSALLLVSVWPMGALATDLIYISEIHATYDFVAPEYAAPHYDVPFTYTVEGDLPITFSSNGADWYRWVDDDWNDSIEYGEYFVEGTYCHDVKILLDDTDHYTWDSNTKLFVNGVQWTGFNMGNWTQSPTFEITYVEGKEFVATFYGQIGDNYVNAPITQKDNNITVVGGTQPYTFTKTGGPDWLAVSNEGIVSGTPTAMGENQDLVVKVTDAMGQEQTVTIHVNDTYLNPADRQVVSRVVGSVAVPTLRCGDSPRAVRNVAAEVTEGAPAFLATSSSDVYVLRESSFHALNDEPLVAGEYYMDVEVIINGEAGRTHVLDKENLEVIINGEPAFDVNPYVTDSSSSDWVKIGGLVVEHWFDNDTDASCNGCDYLREGCDHQYDTPCAPNCNICGESRAVEHEYDNACDSECNKCGEGRVPSDHVWSSCADHYCNVCDTYRESGHQYDGCLDGVCNVCENERTPGHTYTTALDTGCDVCEENRTLKYIQPGDTKTVDITYGNEKVDFLFTPEITMVYCFSATGDFDTFGRILNENYGLKTTDDDGGEGQNFSVVYEMTAGTTYVLRAEMYSATRTGSFTVQLGCETHDYDNTCDAECNICGLIRSINHTYTNAVDTECDVCGDVRILPFIQLNEVKEVTIAKPADFTDFLFTPAVSGKYCFASQGDVDTHGYIYDLDENLLKDNDDCEERNFGVYYDMTAGTTYLLRAKGHSTHVGTFTVSITCVHAYDNDCDTDCNVCGETREVPDHVYSDDCDETCNSCNEEREAPHVWAGDCDGVCGGCGEERTPPVDHTWADCYDQWCDVCDLYRAYGHEFTSACDTTCNNCGAVTEAEEDHDFDNACDTDCNVCGETRTVGDHAYTNACDTDCNECGETRTVGDHAYTDACDTDCNECGETREAPHEYTNACDTDCNACGEIRTVGDHAYANACDTDCNECGETRTVGDHAYANACDTDCNECGETREAPHDWQEATPTEPMTCKLCGTTSGEPLPITYGDADGNGSVDAADALKALQQAVKLITLEEDAFAAANVNGDDKVDATDALLMLQYTVKLIEQFPVEQ